MVFVNSKMQIKKALDMPNHVMWGFLELMSVAVRIVKYEKNRGDHTVRHHRPAQLDEIVIVGNGPSLKESMRKYKDVLKRKTLMCVNAFATTALYTELKPQYYVLADPANYDGMVYRNADKRVRMSVDETRKSLVQKTSWPLTILLPQSAERNERFIKRLKQNSNISIYYYSECPAAMDHVPRKLFFYLLKKDKINIPTITVLHSCIGLSVFFGFRKISLIGADSSWVWDYRIDNATNRLYCDYSHFVSVCARTYFLDEDDDTEIEGSKTASLLKEHSNLFRLYGILNQYAKECGCIVYNASEMSWIDVFERKKLE